MTPAEEEYVHYVECCECLNRAWGILQKLRGVEPKGVIYYGALRYALIEYAKPYTRSDGDHKRGRQGYKLPGPKLSNNDMAVHDAILKARNQALAHSDLTVKDAVVSGALFNGRPSVCVLQNLPFELPTLENIIRVIENSLDAMYPEKSRLEKALVKGSPRDESKKRFRNGGAWTFS